MFPDFSSLIFFLAASIGLLVVPGPAVLYIVAQSIDQGRMAGIVSTMGIAVGTLAHIFAAALGISVILTTSAEAFMVMKYVGAAYLIYLGIAKLISRGDGSTSPLGFERKSLRKIFTQGIVVNVLNPKTALFFFAFLPQFVVPANGLVEMQIVILGLIFILLGMLSDGAYALLAGALRDWLRNSHAFLKAQKYLSGSIYIGLGLATALTGSKNN